MATQAKAPDRRDRGRMTDIDACLSTPDYTRIAHTCQSLALIAKLWGVTPSAMIEAFRTAAAADLQRQISAIDANLAALERQVSHD